MDELVKSAAMLNELVSPELPKSVESGEHDDRLLMTVGLHKKGCTTAGETLVLLGAGYPDGALARWRSLYEIELIAAFIAREGQEIARKYRDHAAIENYRILRLMDESANGLVDWRDLESFKQLRDKVVDMYGTKFKYEYGWAAEVISLGKVRGPNRADLEKAMGREKMAPLYAAANYQVHPNANAVIGLHFAGSGGPAIPGCLASESLRNLTETLLQVGLPTETEKKEDTIKLLTELTEQTVAAFASLP